MTSTLTRGPVAADLPAAPPRQPDDPGALVTPRIVAATARRVLAQLRGDRRTVAMLLVVPSVLLALTNQMFDSQPRFNRVALELLGIFPFTLMFLVTSVAMLRERTSGTLERLLTTPMSKLDLLLGYGVAFAAAAAAQAAVTCASAYWLLGLYTPGNPLLVLAVAVAGAVLGMAIGLLTSAFATSEFQAVQFMPVVVLPQVLLGGLFVPREQMTDWLETVSDALPLSYSIEALQEVGRTSLLTGTLVLDLAVICGAALVALALAAGTLQRQSGGPGLASRAAVRRTVLAGLAGTLVLGAYQVLLAAGTVTTDNAQVDGDRIPVVATRSGTVVEWRATEGAVLRRNDVIGRIELLGGSARPRVVLRAPADATVARSDVVPGAYVTSGTELAVAYQPSAVYVTARVDETDIAEVRPGQRVQIRLDGGPRHPDLGTVDGVVQEIRAAAAVALTDAARGSDDGSGTGSRSAAGAGSRNPGNRDGDNTTAVYDRRTQLVPVRIAVTDSRGLPLLPGMNATVTIHTD